jgi:hypothetical protein
LKDCFEELYRNEEIQRKAIRAKFVVELQRTEIVEIIGENRTKWRRRKG